MSNALGIATVTAVLRDLLNNGLIDASVGDVTVSAQSPDRIRVDAGETAQLNLFMYAATPNQGWRNVALPSIDGPGRTRTTNPPLALDLHYVLTAYGKADFEAEILLGYGMQVLHENPVLDRQAIRDTLAPGPVTGGILPPPLQTLAAAELADQVEQIKIVPQALGSDEISKLWTAFNAHYRPSAAYQASVVLIESRRPTTSALPVRVRQLFVIPAESPVVNGIAAEDGGPIVAASRLVVSGERLLHDPLQVVVDGAPCGIVETAPTRLLVTQPAGLASGVHGLQVKHLLDFGTPNEPHRGLDSNVAAFVLHPEFGGLAFSPAPGVGPYTGDLTVTVAPLPRRAQRIQLLLNPTTIALPGAFAVPAEPRTADGDPVVVHVEAIPKGDYFARVQVDGAASPVDLDPASVTFGPKVTI